MLKFFKIPYYHWQLYLIDNKIYKLHDKIYKEWYDYQYAPEFLYEELHDLLYLSRQIKDKLKETV